MSQVKIEDAAFPSNEYGNLGMSLRDYFAGQALAGIMANAKLVGVLAESKQDPASCAYEMADYMLAERQKERE